MVLVRGHLGKTGLMDFSAKTICMTVNIILLITFLTLGCFFGFNLTPDQKVKSYLVGLLFGLVGIFTSIIIKDLFNLK
jgi:hypothetical protein